MLENEWLIVCPLLTTSDFVKLCKSMSLSVTAQRLDELERIGLFYPFARVRHPRIKEKVEYLDNGRKYRILGILKDGEVWEGDVKEEYASISFRKESSSIWLDRDLIWDPSDVAFEEWKSFIDDDGVRFVTSYYSRFQVYELWSILSNTAIYVNADQWLEYSEDQQRACCKNISKLSDMRMAGVKNRTDSLRQLSYLCQAISNRYHPFTQTDKRRLRLSQDGFFQNWDWYEYCRNWNANTVFKDIELDREQLKNWHQHIALYTQHIDPMERWFNLVSFISVSKKKKLKNEALLAQEFYSMEHMLRLFYFDVTEEELDQPNEGPSWHSEDLYGEGILNSPYEFLERVTNDFGINPRPRLILVVEGKSEEEQFPRIAHSLYGTPFEKVGIELINLGGIGNVLGTKKDKYSALEKFIDYHHSKCTLVVVILDNEDRAATVREKLLGKQSILTPSRKVTTEDYFFLWAGITVELSSFSDVEIAEKLSELADKTGLFAPDEIAQARESTRSGDGDPLSRLYNTKTGYGLNKPELLKRLVDIILAEEYEVAKQRPIVSKIEEVLRLASVNRQGPINDAVWLANQKSGYFGDSVEKE